MTTPLSKPVTRAASWGGRDWRVSLLPPDDVYRFPRVQIVQRRKRTGYWMPLEQVCMDAARRYVEAQKREKAKARKARRA